MLNVLTPLSVSFVLCCASISCVYLMRLVRLSPASISCPRCSSRSSISCVYLLRLSPASISCVLCVCLLRLSHASISCVLCVCLVRLSRLRCCVTPLHSFKHVKRVNSFKRPNVFILLVLFILPPKHFEQFDPFDPFRISQAFNSYNPLSNSSVSIGSKCLPLHALQRVKINFFKRRGKPERFEVFNSV